MSGFNRTSVLNFVPAHVSCFGMTIKILEILKTSLNLLDFMPILSQTKCLILLLSRHYLSFRCQVEGRTSEMAPAGHVTLYVLSETPHSVRAKWEAPAKPNGNLTYTVLFTGPGKSNLTAPFTPPHPPSVPSSKRNTASLHAASAPCIDFYCFPFVCLQTKMLRGQRTLAHPACAVMGLNELLSASILLRLAARCYRGPEGLREDTRALLLSFFTGWEQTGLLKSVMAHSKGISHCLPPWSLLDIPLFWLEDKRLP